MDNPEASPPSSEYAHHHVNASVRSSTNSLRNSTSSLRASVLRGAAQQRAQTGGGITRSSDGAAAFSEAFSMNEDSTTNFGEGPPPDADLQLQQFLAARETYWLWILRIMVVLVLLGVGAGMAYLTFWYTRSVETAAFYDTFDDYAQQIVRRVRISAQQQLEAVGAIALQIQAYALTSRQEWPFVTIPFFEEHIRASESLTDAWGVLFFPIVETSQREAWEMYSTQHGPAWMEESYETQRYYSETGDVDGLSDYVPYGAERDAVQDDWFMALWRDENKLDPLNPPFLNGSLGMSTVIFKTRHENDPDSRAPRIDDTKGPYFPQWQAAPMSGYYQSTVNLNYGHYEDFYNQTQIVIHDRSAVYGMGWTDDNAPGFISTLLYPILDKFASLSSRKHDNNNTNNNDTALEEPEVVAFLSLDIFWVDFLTGILPNNANGLYVVISNGAPCNQMFTYMLRGSDAEFLGEGDLHELAFDGLFHLQDDLYETLVFGSELMEPIDPNATTYTGQPLDGSMCPYTFDIYPSQEMQDTFLTSYPAIYSTAAALTLVFATIVFIVYDALVERRQRLIMANALRSDKLVLSLIHI